MIPRKLYIEGIGPHIDTEVDFAQHRSPLAICAPKGTGKTFLIEAIFMALFGRGLWYSGIYDAMTQGGTGKARIIFYFSHKGREYRVERILKVTAKTQSQDAYLSDPSDSHSDFLAGPKIADFDRAIHALMGDADTAASTWFMGQNRLHDLAGKPGDPNLRAHRRDAFHSFLGTEVIESYYVKAGEALTDRETRADELDAQLVETPDYEAQLQEAGEAKLLAELRRNDLKIEVEKYERTRETLRESLAKIDAGVTQHTAAVERYNLAREKSDTALDALADLGLAITRLEDRAGRGVAARQDLEALERLQGERDELRERAEAWSVWRLWSAEREHLDEVRKQAERSHSDALAQRIEISDATRALADGVAECERQYRTASLCNQTAGVANEFRADKRKDQENIIAQLAGSRQQLERRQKIGVEPPLGDQCGIANCPYIADFLEIGNALNDVNIRDAVARSALGDIEPDIKIQDLDEIIERGQSARACANQVDKSLDRQRTVDRAGISMAMALEACEAHAQKAAPSAPAADPTEALERVQQDIDALAGAAERLKQAEQAEIELAAKKAELPVARQRSIDAKADSEAVRPAAQTAEHALENIEGERARLNNEIADETDEITVAKDFLASAVESIGNYAGRIVTLEAQQLETESKQTRLGNLRRAVAALEDVKRCFSPRGVRQILIDNAVPDLESIANDLFLLATGGQQQLSIHTQRRAGAGHLVEDFAIMVTDGCGERDVTRFSGGELLLIQIILRAAVALWLGNLRGQRPECLILDEAFDNLGAEGTAELLQVLERLGGQFDKIIVVTHDQNIADRMPSRINLARGVSGARILGGAA